MHALMVSDYPYCFRYINATTEAMALHLLSMYTITESPTLPPRNLGILVRFLDSNKLILPFSNTNKFYFGFLKFLVLGKPLPL